MFFVNCFLLQPFQTFSVFIIPRIMNSSNISGFSYSDFRLISLMHSAITILIIMM